MNLIIFALGCFSVNVLALCIAHAAAGIKITSETPITQWRGEPMDDQLVVEGLLQ